MFPNRLENTVKNLEIVEDEVGDYEHHVDTSIPFVDTLPENPESNMSGLGICQDCMHCISDSRGTLLCTHTSITPPVTRCSDFTPDNYFNPYHHGFNRR